MSLPIDPPTPLAPPLMGSRPVAQPQPPPQQPQMLAPLAQHEPESDRKKKKKKKKKKKEGLVSKMFAKLALGSAEAWSQVGEAMTDAAKKYARKHRKSRDKKRGGWRKDLGKNVASATGELMTKSAKAPVKFIRELVKKDKKKKKDREPEPIPMGVEAPIDPTRP